VRAPTSEGPQDGDTRQSWRAGYPVAVRGGDRTTGPLKRGRVASGILTAQLLISGPILVVVMAAVIVEPALYAQPILLAGVAFFF
jgi:hypothetical protein